MVPGDNLEFKASGYFRSRAEGEPDLLPAVKKALREDPKAGKIVAGQVRELSVMADREDFTVFFKREGNQVALMHVFEDALEAGKIASTREDLKKRIQKGELQ